MAGTSAGAKKGWATRKGRGGGRKLSKKVMERRAKTIHLSNIYNAKGIGKGKIIPPKKYILGS
jgi:hypothetical protein